MTTTTTAVTCDQILFTSAARTLSGRGFGVIGSSKNWPDRALALGSSQRLFSFLPQDNRKAALDAPPLHCLARYHHGDGYVIARKTPSGADANQRPGNYLVHALLDREGDLSPSAIIALWDGDVPLRTTPALGRASRDLAQIDVPVSQAPHLPIDEPTREVLVDLTQAVLSLPRLGRQIGLVCPDSANAAAWLTSLFHLLPIGIAQPLTFSTFEKDPAKTDVDIVTCIPGRSAPLPKTFEYITAEAAELYNPDEAENSAAQLLVDAYRTGRTISRRVTDAKTVRELLLAVAFTHNETLPLSALSDESILDLIAHSNGWVATTAERRLKLVNLISREETCTKAAQALAHASDQGCHSEKERRVLASELMSAAVTSTVRGRPRAGARMREAAIGLGAVDDFSTSVVKEATTMLQNPTQRQLLHLDTIHPYISAALPEMARADLRLWAKERRISWLATEAWTALSETVLFEYLSETSTNVELCETATKLLRTYPTQALDVVKCVIARHGTHTLENPLLRAVGGVVTFQILFQCPLPVGYLFNDLLPRLKSLALKREVMGRLWPMLTEQAGLDPNSVELLVAVASKSAHVSSTGTPPVDSRRLLARLSRSRRATFKESISLAGAPVSSPRSDLPTARDYTRLPWSQSWLGTRRPDE